jgi:hypothetical protein
MSNPFPCTMGTPWSSADHLSAYTPWGRLQAFGRYDPEGIGSASKICPGEKYTVVQRAQRLQAAGPTVNESCLGDAWMSRFSVSSAKTARP